MGLFNRSIREKRSIDDILTPKNDDEVCEAEKGEEVSQEPINVPLEDKKKDIQVESPEEVSFNALTCFGWSETKTPKWLIKCAHFWYGAMSFFWFILGALTFAPIIFMQKKVNVIFKNKFKSFITSAIIYALFWALLIVLFATRNGDKATEVVNTANSAFLYSTFHC